MMPDWWVYEPGVAVKCPAIRCQSFLAIYGMGLRAYVRLHPKGRKGQQVPEPTDPYGECRPCRTCGQAVEIRLEVVDRTARVA